MHFAGSNSSSAVATALTEVCQGTMPLGEGAGEPGVGLGGRGAPVLGSGEGACAQVTPGDGAGDGGVGLGGRGAPVLGSGEGACAQVTPGDGAGDGGVGLG